MATSWSLLRVTRGPTRPSPTPRTSHQPADQPWEFSFKGRGRAGARFACVACGSTLANMAST